MKPNTCEYDFGCEGRGYRMILDHSYQEPCDICLCGERFALRSESKSFKEIVEEKDVTITRLRTQNKTSSDAWTKRIAKTKSELDKTRGLMRRAYEYHKKDMQKQGLPIWSNISGYGQGAAAVLLEQREEALLNLSKAIGLIEKVSSGSSRKSTEVNTTISELKEFLQEISQ